MKLEDIKIGQFLKDKFGNRYKVVEVNEDDDFAPVELKCVKFVNSVYFGSTCFGHSNNHITEIGSRVWVLKDYSRLISSNGFVGEFLKRNFCSDINVDKLRRIELSFNGIKRDFIFGSPEDIAKIEVTLKDLCIDDNTNYPTKYNVRLDDIIVDKSGTEYIVIARNNAGIEVKYKREFIGYNGKVFDINSKIYIPFPNSIYPDDTFITKEFVFKNK
jgi:hypothetical protein